MAELYTQLAPKKVRILLSPRARNWLARSGYDPIYGARPLSRLIQTEIKDTLSEEILFGKLANGGEVTIGLKRNCSERIPVASQKSPFTFRYA